MVHHQMITITIAAVALLLVARTARVATTIAVALPLRATTTIPAIAMTAVVRRQWRMATAALLPATERTDTMPVPRRLLAAPTSLTRT